MLEFISQLESQNVFVGLDGEDLKISFAGSLSPELIGQIRTHKPLLVDYLKKYNVRAAASAIPAAPRRLCYPLSPGQLRIWFDRHSRPGNDPHILSNQVTLDGEYDIARLVRAIGTVVDRHEALRTVFRPDDNGDICQWVLDREALQFEVRVEDVPAGTDQEAFFADLTATFLRKPFDLENGPLVRCGLFRVAPGEKNVLCFAIHHIVSDGWSMNVLEKDLLTCYEAYGRGLPPALPPLAIQYKDYTLWQLDQLQKNGAQSRAFWLSQFEGDIPVLQFPATHPRPATGSRTLLTYLPKETTAALRNYCRRKGGSTFTGLVATLNVLLSKYTGQRDLVVGTLVSGREHPDLAHQIGYYVNTLALRNQLEPNDSFDDFYGRCKDRVLRALEHQAYPYERLVTDLNGEREAGGGGLFDVLVNLLNLGNAVQHGHAGPISDGVLDLGESQGTFGLEFVFAETEDYISCKLTFNAAMFDPVLMSDCLLNYKRMLAAILRDPARELRRLEYLSDASRKQLLEEFNNSRLAYPKDKTLRELFREQLQQAPDAVALVAAGKEFTCRWLEETSNQFADYLRSAYAVGAGDRIGLCLDQSEWVPVAILAALKAGAAYVPMDSENPAERVRYFMSDSHCKALIDAAAVEAFARHADRYSKLPPPDHQQALLAVIYTSGSTSTPKGVAIRHAGLLNRLYWMWETYPFGPGEVASMRTSIGFVDHLWEFFGPLLRGVKLVIFNKAAVLDLEGFVARLGACGVTRLVLVPSLLKEMLTLEEVTALEALRYWTCSGEYLPASLVEHFYRKFPNHVLLNIYGSTEVTADATLYDTSAAHARAAAPVALPALFACHSAEPLHQSLQQNNPYGNVFTGQSAAGGDAAFTGVSLRKQKTLPEYRAFLQRDVAAGVVNVASAKFIGHMTGPVPPVIADLHQCISLLNQNLVKHETSGMATLLERQVLGCFHKLCFDLPDAFYHERVQDAGCALGNITSGGTLSNITALSYALSSTLGSGINKTGLAEGLRQHGYTGVAVVGSPHCHYSINKAMRILGLGTNAFVACPLDSDDPGRNRDRLRGQIERLRQNNILVLALVGVAGTTESGKIDPLALLADAAQQFGIHFHVDAAFGGAFLFSDKHVAKFDGISRADTVTICGHKQLYLPMGISLCLFRNPDFVKNAEINTYYQARRGSLDLGKYTIEGSRPFSALILHGALQVVGKEGYAEILESNFDKAALFAALAGAREEFQLYQTPTLNIVLYRYVPKHLAEKRAAGALTAGEREELNELNRAIQARQFKNGNSFVSYTELAAGPESTERVVWFRVVMMNPYTTRQHLEEILDEQCALAGELLGKAAAYPAASRKKSVIPIGKPIGNVQIYILDGDQQLVPLGVAGEIYVGGEGVADGYLNSQAHTEQKFIRNRFCEGSNERLYKTGDLGRWLPDGNVEYLGRIDNQVKINGKRADLGEIELALEQSGLVQEAVVTVRRDEKGNDLLVGYVTGAGALDKVALQVHLKAKLPGYMVPGCWVQLDALPLTTSGKVDRKALPAPDFSAFSDGYVAPRSRTEKLLAAAWQHLFGTGRIGIHDNFFQRGGQSLLAMRLVAAIRKAVGFQMEVTTVFQLPTIAQLARFLDENPGRTPARNLVRAPAGEGVPLTEIQKVYWLAIQDRTVSFAYNMTVGWELSGNVVVEKMREAFGQLLERHTILRAVIRYDAEGHLKLYDQGAEATLAAAFLTSDAGELPLERPAVLALYNQESKHPFDLENGPLIRFRLIGNGPGAGVIFCNVHHIISDGFSMDLMLRDLLGLYHRAIGHGAALPLPEITFSFYDYAYTAWLHHQEEEMTSHQDFWRAYLRNRVAVAHLRGALTTGSKSVQAQYAKLVLSDPAVLQAIRAYGEQKQSTLFVTLLAFVKTLVHLETGQPDISIASPVNNRNQEELMPLVGLFLNTVLIRSVIPENADAEGLYDTVKHSVLAAMAHSDYPFLKVLALEKETNGADGGRFSIGFNLSPIREAIPLPDLGLAFTPLAAADHAVKADLWFDVHENDEAIVFNLSYRTEVFEAFYVRQLLSRLQRIIECFVAGENPRLEVVKEKIAAAEKEEQQQKSEMLKRRNLAKLTS